MNEFLNEMEVKRAIPVATQVSAGGVMFRRDDLQVEIVLILVSPHRRWQLPKGTVDEGETLEQAAAREVREETGIDGEIVVHLETIEYWYVGNSQGLKTKFHKFVHFYLLQFVDGDVSRHDHEVTEARWVTIDQALEMLAFKNEVEVVKKAAQLIKDIIN